MSSILAKMAVQISANNADFNKAMMTSSKSLKGFSAEAQLSQTRVGQLATQISSFANPFTAAIAVVGGLTAAYAQSTIGAKDLEFAHKQLGAAVTVITNEFASLFSGVEDGEGIVSRFVNSMFALIPGLAESTFAIAKAGEALEDLQRDEKLARGENQILLADNLELMTQLAEENVNANDASHITSQILENINIAQDRLVAGSENLVKNGVLLTKEELKTAGVLTRQLQAKQQQLNADKENEKLLDERASIILEILTQEKDFERLRQKALRTESNLLEADRKRLSVKREIKAVEATPSSVNSNLLGDTGVGGASGLSDSIAQAITNAIAQIQRLPPAIKTVKEELEEINLGGAISGSIGELANAFGEASVGVGDFGSAILKSLASFAQQFGALLIAAGVGKITFDSFKSGPAMIAAGAALVALGGAVRGAIANRPNLGGGGSSGRSGGFTSPSNFTMATSAAQNSFSLDSVIRGQDLHVILSNYERNNKSTRG